MARLIAKFGNFSSKISSPSYDTTYCPTYSEWTSMTMKNYYKISVDTGYASNELVALADISVTEMGGTVNFSYNSNYCGYMCKTNVDFDSMSEANRQKYESYNGDVTFYYGDTISDGKTFTFNTKYYFTVGYMTQDLVYTTGYALSSAVTPDGSYDL